MDKMKAIVMKDEVKAEEFLQSREVSSRIR